MSLVRTVRCVYCVQHSVARFLQTDTCTYAESGGKMCYALSHKFSIRHIIMIDKGKFAQHPNTANESFCKIRHCIRVVHRLLWFTDDFQMEYSVLPC